MSGNQPKGVAVRDERVYEEMSRLNNQLSDMHRELARKNAALERLKAGLEQRVEERTADLTSEISKHKQTEKRLRKAFKEIEQLKKQLHSDYTYLQEELKSEHNFEDIIGKSDVLKYVLFKIEQVATTDATVLLLGETGTGKELVARAIHNRSPRNKRPLVKLDCATLAPNLIESELFGREKGAFTGAQERQVGRFEFADGSTIFLDEIGELPLALQSKLLRVIQDGEFERLGGNRSIKVDVRIIAATNRNLEEEIKKGRFRQDLWYRLHVFPITLPPLRQRTEDIPLLVNEFVKRYGKKIGKRITSVPDTTMDKLKRYPWPGNIRELQNVIERAVINTPGTVLLLADKLERSAVVDSGEHRSQSLREIEREGILRVLEEVRWKIEGEKGAAALLGLNPSTLRGKMRKLNLRKK